MKIRIPFCVSVALSFIAICCTTSFSRGLVGQSSHNELPNVLIFLVDDLGWSDVGFNGSQYYSTPNIDQLAREGMIMTRAYSCGPNCAPSRASLMSGQYTPRHGVITVNNSDRGKSKHRMLIPNKNKKVLAARTTTLPELFKQRGYRTAFFGKWHLGSADSTASVEAQGFDLNVGGNHTGHPRSYFVPYSNPQLPDGPEGEYLTDRIADEVVGFLDSDDLDSDDLDERETSPFYAQVSFYSVHTPIQAKPELVAQFKDVRKTGFNAKYAAMVASVDQAVGRIMDKLRELKQDENTLVIFTSDNGGLGRVTDNSPLRGSKGMLYEGGIRVPTAVCWPKLIQPGSVCDVPVIGVDFYATACDLLNVRPAEQVVDGQSLLSLFRGEESALQSRAIFWHFPAYLQGKNARGARDDLFRTRPCGVIQKGQWKLIEYFEDGQVELYHLAEDIGETNNLSGQHRATAEALLEELVDWRRDVGATVPRQLNPRFEQN